MATITLRRGTSSVDVLELRKLLDAKGYGTNTSPADPYAFDDELDAAVRRFQGAMKLATDGIVGANTWTALRGITVKVSPTSDVMVPVEATPASSSSSISMPLVLGGLAVVAVALVMMSSSKSSGSVAGYSARRKKRKARRARR